MSRHVRWHMTNCSVILHHHGSRNFVQIGTVWKSNFPYNVRAELVNLYCFVIVRGSNLEINRRRDDSKTFLLASLFIRADLSESLATMST